MERLLIIGGLFVLAGLCEIGGGYLVWGWMREHRPLLWALLGAAVPAAYGVVQRSVNVLHCARSKPRVQLLAVQAARVGGGQLLELDATQGRLKMYPNDLLVALPGSLSDRVAYVR